MIFVYLLLFFYFESPKDTLNLSSSEFIVRKSGLQPKVYYPLMVTRLTLYFLFLVSYLYADKLVKTAVCKRTLVRFRRCVFVIYFSLLLVTLQVIMELPFGVFALSRLSSMQFADIIHSPLPFSLILLLLAAGFLPFFHKQVKFYRANSLSSILSRLNSTQPPTYQQN